MSQDKPSWPRRKTRIEPTFADIMKRIYDISQTQTQVQLAAFLDIKQSSISDAKRRGSIPADWLLKLMEKRNVNPFWVRTGDGSPYLHDFFSRSKGEYTLPGACSENTVTPEARTLPVFSLESDPAGKADFPCVETGRTLTLPEGFAKGVTVCLVRESAMSPLICPGAYVGIATGDRSLCNGEMYAVETAWAGVVLRRAWLEAENGEDGMVTLQAVDPRCPSLRLAAGEFARRARGRLAWTLQRTGTRAAPPLPCNA